MCILLRVHSIQSHACARLLSCLLDLYRVWKKPASTWRQGGACEVKVPLQSRLEEATLQLMSQQLTQPGIGNPGCSASWLSKPTCRARQRQLIHPCHPGWSGCQREIRPAPPLHSPCLVKRATTRESSVRIKPLRKLRP